MMRNASTDEQRRVRAAPKSIDMQNAPIEKAYRLSFDYKTDRVWPAMPVADAPAPTGAVL
ncbi:hypothetical protein [Methylocapsa acidiphila]|uniref:hypothetical protein n=1 Tax=Methylocapsa acidiphila TaxID=133552 RepID=UPI0003FA1B41|nr:hypothetical protein [Methylocapsa acidiphila]